MLVATKGGRKVDWMAGQWVCGSVEQWGAFSVGWKVEYLVWRWAASSVVSEAEKKAEKWVDSSVVSLAVQLVEMSAAMKVFG